MAFNKVNIENLLFICYNIALIGSCCILYPYNNIKIGNCQHIFSTILTKINNRIMSNIQTVKGMTERKRAFIYNICDRGLPVNLAAKEAGYASSSSKYLLSDPSISAAIQERMLYLFRAEDAPIARQVLRAIMIDESANVKARIECAKALLNRGGFVEPKASIVAEGEVKEASEMTGQEIQSAIESLTRELGVRAVGAKLVESEAIEVEDTIQVVDIL